MITISDSLASAATARSRAPICKVTAREGSVPEPTVLVSDASLPYRLHRFQAGSGFYIITATSGSTIYYKRTTTIGSAADWTGGYSSLATASSVNAARLHDMGVFGNRVIVVYEKSGGSVYARESSNGGSSWDAEYEIIDLSATEVDVGDLSIADVYTVFIRSRYQVVGGSDGMYKVSRAAVGMSWFEDSRWDCGWHYASSDVDWFLADHNIHARELDTAHYRIVGSWGKGNYEYFAWAQMIDCVYGGWSTLDPLFGGYTVDAQYAWLLTGMSREFNGYHFGSLYERYIASADAASNEAQYELSLGRTEDLKTFSVVPFSRRDFADTDAVSWSICGIGLTEGSDYVCIPMTQQDNEYGPNTTNGVVYLVEPSAWFGESATEEDITHRVVDNIAINRAANKASSTALALSCRQDKFENSAVSSPGSVIDIYSGYRTEVGAELQKRFTGSITSSGRVVGGENILRANILDSLATATSRKQRLPAVLRGQDVFHADFTSSADADLFAQQEGLFAIDGEEFVASTGGRHIAIAGYDPSDAVLLTMKFKMTGSLAGSDVGILFHGKTYWENISLYKHVVWHADSSKFAYHEYLVDSNGGVRGRVHEWSTATLSVSLDTYYWIMVKLKHGQLDAWYSTDGINWTACLSAIDVAYFSGSPTYLDPDGYIGVTAYVNGIGGDVRIDEFDAFSLYPPQSGSDVMRYLAAISNMDTNEKMEVDDTFSGIDFDDEWDTPGVDGTWSVAGGTALGYKSATAALLKCTTNAENAIVRATVYYDEPAGVFVRGSDDLSQCYALVLDLTDVYLKKKDTSWSTLMQMPWTPPSMGGPGPIAAADILLHCSGPFITGFVNGAMVVSAYDEDFTSGYCGMVAEGTAGSPSVIFDFRIDGFYIGVDVATVRPKDTAASVMAQLTNRYDGGAFFADADGKLRWGTFTGTVADLDIRQVTSTMNVNRQLDRLLSYLRLVGENTYGEVKDRDWGRALGGYNYDASEDKTIRTRHGCNELAEAILAESQRIDSNTAMIAGHPGLEIGDIVDIAEEPGGTPEARRVWAYGETIGSVYEISMADLRTQTEEVP